MVILYWISIIWCGREISRPYHAKSFRRFDTISLNHFIIRVFRRETASGFYPWGNVEGPRKRVAEGLCGWRHGNLFPMTQSAQSHRQMRSIPRCSKAVFYVFVFFDSIHDSATMHTLSPEIFHRTEIMPKGGSEIKRVCITWRSTLVFFLKYVWGF